MGDMNRSTKTEAKFGDFDRSCVPSLKIGVIGGTRGYESPERMMDPLKRSEQDDAWALGVICLIAGTIAGSPFTEMTTEEVARFDPYQYLLKYHRKDWSREQVKKVANACTMLLRFSPEDRPESLDAVIQLLEEACTMQVIHKEMGYTLERHNNLIDLTREDPLSEDQYIDDLSMVRSVSSASTAAHASVASSSHYEYVTGHVSTRNITPSPILHYDEYGCYLPLHSPNTAQYQ